MYNLIFMISKPSLFKYTHILSAKKIKLSYNAFYSLLLFIVYTKEVSLKTGSIFN